MNQRWLIRVLIPLIFTSSISFGFGGGVIVGNGGGTVDEDSIQMVELQEFLPSSKLFILSWLRGFELRERIKLQPKNKGKASVEKLAERLFFGQTEVYQIIEDLHILFETKSFCPALDRGHADGSVLGLNPGVICISGYSLIRKLNRSNARVQLEGLILHEISHLIGASEDEAQDLQRRYIREMRMVSGNHLQWLYSKKRKALKEVHSQLDIMKSSLDRTQFCLERDEALLLLGAVVNPDPFGASYVFSMKERDQGRDLRRWLRAVFDWSICLADADLRAVQVYQNVFGNQKWLEVDQFIQGVVEQGHQELLDLVGSDFSQDLPVQGYRRRPLKVSETMIQRMDDSQILKNELTRIQKKLKELIKGLSLSKQSRFVNIIFQ